MLLIRKTNRKEKVFLSISFCLKISLSLLLMMSKYFLHPVFFTVMISKHSSFLNFRFLEQTNHLLREKKKAHEAFFVFTFNLLVVQSKCVTKIVKKERVLEYSVGHGCTALLLTRG